MEEPSVSELIAAGDPDAAAGFFDARAPSVREYCGELADAELVDEATLAAFVEFLARVRTAPRADADELLRRSARTTAVARMPLRDTWEQVCRDVSELLAARANGELAHHERAIAKHIERCSLCQHTVERLAQAEDAFIRRPAGPPPEPVRSAWLELAARATPADGPRPTRARRGGLLGAARRLLSAERRMP